ncbi:precorrin-3B synthase [Methylobacterium sp. NEAU 140]|uniref:precorrin-3B synthase n=1 Tax=Methylobacterium sp. NEAU 140 TaxID=3064945 RepID=UPI00273272F7|nr:precorrin-3B synthase [Methylobacterium sp. NEAU 140]MDP4022151.1 precorrin-3B synthase [Methylobacterium sp. NEAU 140]
MSAARRALPESPARRGWCPGLSRPMPTGDGLLARVHPPLGILTLPQARAVAEGARRFGNGHIDLTARANLQIRGVSEATRGPLARLLEAAGLGDARADGGPQRLTLTGPLAGRDPAEIVDVAALARAIEAAGRAVPGLPAKTLVAVEGRPGAPLPDADFFVFALAPDRVGLAVSGTDGLHELGTCAAGDAPGAVGTLLAAFVASGRRRARDLSETERATLVTPVSDLNAPSPPPSAGEGGPRRGSGEGSAVSGEAATGATISGVALPLSPPAPQGTLPRTRGRESDGIGEAYPLAGISAVSPGLTALALDAPFGRCTADALDRLADVAATLGAAEIRLSPTRGFVLLTADAARAASVLAERADAFVTAPDDPRRAVAACTGAPACASGTTPTLIDADRIAREFRPLAARGLSAHVSGCAKGCARPAPADLTLVGRDGRYGVLVGGAPGDAPGFHLPIEAALERIGKAAIVGLAAAFAPEAGTVGRDRRPG